MSAMMVRSIRWSLGSVLLVLCAGPLASGTEAPASTSAAAPQTFKIGVIVSITGPVAPGLKSMYDAIKPTQDLLNQMGGITVNGQKYNIEYDVQDDKSSPPDGVAAINRLIQNGVKYLIAPIVPPIGLAIAPICEQAKILRVNPSQPEASFYGKENSLYFNAFMSSYNIPATYDFLVKHYPNVKKIAQIVPDDPGSVTESDMSSQECAKHGLTLVAKERFPNDTADFTSIVTKMLAQKPDAIDAVGELPIWTVSIINSARDQGFTGPVFGGSILGDPNLLISMVKPPYLDDIFTATPDVLNDQMSPVVKQLRPMVEKTGSQFIFDSVNDLNSTTVMLAGIQKAQSFDTDKVKEALESMDGLEIPWGKAVWRGQELGVLNHLLKLEKVPISWIMKGKVQFEFVPNQ